MSKKWYVLALISLILISGIGIANAHSPFMHMYVGSKTFSVWNTYDPEFYNALINDENVYLHKFYYIGLTLPDMLDMETQEKITKLINKFYNNRSYFTQQLYITDNTKNYCQTTINCPSHDISKLWYMVKQAKDNNWSLLRKSIIYGAYMHVIQDKIAHQVMQPASLGHGIAIESDVVDNQKLLEIPESYQELFSSTYIPDWSFITKLYLGRDVNLSQWAYGDFEFVMFCMTVDNPNSAQRLCGWQDYESFNSAYLDPVSYFAVAAIDQGYCVGYSGPDLYWKLKSYMTGWGIMLFSTCGYNMNTNPPSDIGGLLSHPNWKPTDYKDFLVSAATRYVTLPFPLNIFTLLKSDWFFGLIPGVETLVKDIIDWIFDNYDIPNMSWTTYLESSTYLENFYNSLPPEVQNEIGDKYTSMIYALRNYEQYSTIKKPNLRSSYADQPGLAVSCAPLYKQAIGDPQWLEKTSTGASTFLLSRKAGLLGGMFPLELTRPYDYQPGIFDMHFERNGNYVYTTQALDYPTNDNISVKYDVVTVGINDIRVMGKNLDITEPTPLVSTGNMPIFSHQQGNLSYLAQTAIQNGYTELSFEGRSRSQGSPPYYYEQMISSDYRDKYNANMVISNNSNYVYWFKNGQPTRNISEDPLANPVSYWPYTLQLGVMGLAVNFESVEWYLKENQIAYSQDVSSQSAIRVGADGTVAPHNGTWMYKVTGIDGSGTVENELNAPRKVLSSSINSFCYWNLTNIPIVVTENTYLSFWRYVKESPSDQGRIFIDGVTSDGKTLRDWDVGTYLCDQNGTRAHPTNARPQTPTDGWRQYIVNLSPMAGNVVNLMIGYDDQGAESGTFTAYFDDIEIRQGYPYSNQWYAEEFGDNNGSTVALVGKSGDGMDLNYNVWYTYAGELSEWKNGPYLRKNIEPDFVTPDDKDIFVNWTQYDYNHSLHYMLLMQGADNVDRWLIYSANASNHWGNQGWVDMSANPTGIFYQDVTYNRNASLDYCTEFGVRAASLKETRVGHFSSTKWSGPSGGYVKDITINQGTLALPASPGLTGSYYSVAMSKGIPDPEARSYYAILSWTSRSGSYPIQSYQIQAHYTESPTWTDRATVYTGYWKDTDWPLGVIEYRVRSVDSKGNVGPWSNIFKASEPITNDPIIASSTTDEATAYSNGKKIMVDNSGKLHVVFASNDSVYYCISTDDGNTWSSASSVGQGKNPAIELSGAQKPMVCWSKGNELYRAEKDSLKFTEPQMIYAGPEGTEISYLAYVLDQATDNSYLGWVDDGPSGSAVYISPYNPNTSANLSPTPIDQGGTTAFKSPSLALDKKGKLKTAWSKNGIVFFNDENGLTQISNNGIHPIVETYGDKTTVVWQEEILPDIYQVVKKVKGPKGWSEKQLVSYPDSLNADFPVVAASGQYVYCKNLFDDYYDVIWRGDYDNGWQRSVQDITAFSGGISKYPTAVFKQKWPQSKLYIVWTEDMSNNSKGSKATSIVSNVKNYTLSVDPVSYYYADAGTEESDIYNYQKSGSFYYGPQPEYTVDYHATELKYNFQNLDPKKRYRIKVVYYHELDKYVIQTLSVDNTFKKKTTVDPMTVCTEEHWIPTSCIMDGQVDVTITKSNGQYAVCSVIALYEYDKDCTDKSGDDISESISTVVTQFRYELMQNYPNPNTGKTAIKYQLAKPGKVSLKIYNTLGQVVKTLVSQEQQPGYYNAAWDGKDNGGRQTSAGVYFYRLESGDFKATKKMVVIK